MYEIMAEHFLVCHFIKRKIYISEVLESADEMQADPLELMKGNSNFFYLTFKHTGK